MLYPKLTKTFVLSLTMLNYIILNHIKKNIFVDLCKKSKYLDRIVLYREKKYDFKKAQTLKLPYYSFMSLIPLLVTSSFPKNRMYYNLRNFPFFRKFKAEKLHLKQVQRLHYIIRE